MRGLRWQLSLEDNEITSLSGLSKLLSLMEVYIGNNRLTQLKEVQQLKGLPKLIILDLSGNAMCDELDYRLYPNEEAVPLRGSAPPSE